MNENHTKQMAGKRGSTDSPSARITGRHFREGEIMENRNKIDVENVYAWEYAYVDTFFYSSEEALREAIKQDNESTGFDLDYDDMTGDDHCAGDHVVRCIDIIEAINDYTPYDFVVTNYQGKIAMRGEIEIDDICYAVYLGVDDNQGYDDEEIYKTDNIIAVVEI